MAKRAVAYRAANPAACRATWRQYNQRNPDVKRSINSRRRARLRAVLVERFRHQEIFERDGWRCQICMRKVRRNAPGFHPLSPSLDHVIPLVDGGPHTRANTRCAHLRCNTARGARGGNEQLALI
jgi:5-methylcytosine-specific restriction endonuclease McrA